MTAPPQLNKPHTVKFTADQFRLMSAQGVLAEGDRYELIDGEIIVMSPIGLKHAVCVGRISNNLVLKLGRRAIIWVQNPIELGRRSILQPDITVLQYRHDFYEQALPTPADIVLIIEVADSSLEYDGDVKAKLYSAVAIPQMWLVDINAKNITSFSQASALGYKQTCLYTEGDRPPILDFGSVMLECGELF
jgi:Uncharacterized protein conserved in cyanobacteria